ncbi:MAG TPA: FAD-binding oxidoreductase [Acidimicrobiales bacterium]|jgi:FAD/FMN-containing dehydrogenase
MPSALDVLRSNLDDAGFIDDPDVLAAAAHEPTGRFGSPPTAIVRPAGVEEVAAVLATCTEHGVAIVAQGGNTGLVGGSVAHDGEVLLSLVRLVSARPVDPLAAAVTLAAGVTCASADALAEASAGGQPLRFPVDLGSRDSATIGGMVATNAGGLRFLRLGGMRRHVIGAEAVLADGRVVSHLDAPAKDNTGYHLPSLLCGSEGTLAVVTAVTVGLLPRPKGAAVAMAGFDSFETAVEACAALRDTDVAVEAIELVTRAGVELVLDRLGGPPPFDPLPPVMVLVERVGSDDPDGVARLLGGLGIDDAIIATGTAQRRALWALREEHTGAIGALAPVHKLDVTLPLSALAAFASEVPASVAAVAPDAAVWLFGHAGDGNLHVNVTGAPATDGGHAVDDAVLRLVSALGGSISAEHGIGVAKRPWLHLARSDAEIDTFRRLKRALDPEGILNPAVLLPPTHPG